MLQIGTTLGSRRYVETRILQTRLERTVILLYGGSPSDVIALRHEIRSIANTKVAQVMIHKLPFVRSIEKCTLIALASDRDISIVQFEGSTDFKWLLRPGSWDIIEGLLEPFSKSLSGLERYQYLNPAGGPQVIYSTGRHW